MKNISLFEITEKMDNTTTKDFAPLLSKVDTVATLLALAEQEPFPKVDKVEEEYIAQLEDVQRKAMEIAKSHLGTSFNIKRSNGFIEWMKKQKD